jgi:small subunit ribosomal protein S2
MKELLETGVHFGHRTRKWNPKMARYIFTERKGIHIIDLEQTVEMFKRAYFFVRDQSAAGKEILFVGTKKQVQTTIVEEARRCGAHYVNRRWLGGTLTNFATIQQSIKRMKELELMIEDGTIEHVPNKEATGLRRDLAKLQRNLEGLRHLERIPSLLYVIDPDVEKNAVREANILGIPVLAIVDTNCDPDPIEFPIPGNDDAIKATKLITSRIADAVLEGREGRQDAEEAPETSDEAAESEKDEPAEVVGEEAEAPVEEASAEEASVEEVSADGEEIATAEEPTEAEDASGTEESEAVAEEPEPVAVEAEAEASNEEGTERL